MTQEALKLALEALERFEGNKKLWPEAITAIKEALAQTQEPVAWLSTDSIGERHLCFDKPLDNDPVQPLSTAPPQRTWVGLNDDEIDYLIHLAYTGDEEFVQTIEAKLKEKNT